MFLPCITGGEFKIENRSRYKREDVLLALKMCGFSGTFLGRCLGSSSGCAKESIWDMVLGVIKISLISETHKATYYVKGNFWNYFISNAN